MRRTLYVDGFNFYYGVTGYWDREKHLPGLGWCNFRALIERHFPDNDRLRVKYFTAPITPSVELPHRRPGEHRRYSDWRRALQTIDDLLVVESFYKRAVAQADLLHHASGSGPVSIGCDFENGVVTRFLST